MLLTYLVHLLDLLSGHARRQDTIGSRGHAGIGARLLHAGLLHSGHVGQNRS